MKTRITLTLTASILLAAVALADDWPQWQGPDRNAMSKERGLLQEWPTGGPPLAWKITGLGGGYSAPAVAAGRLYGLSNRGGDEVVWCLSEADGKTLWTTRLAPAAEGGRDEGREGTGCTPTVDGDRLYAIGLNGDLACLNVADGKIIWHRSLTKDFGGRVPMWRYNESPLVDGDRIICTPGGADATLVALNKMTGETIWKSKPDSSGGKSGAGYASAIAIDAEGQRQYVQFTAGTLIGVAAADGKFLWKYSKPANENGINCSTPIFADGLVFASSAYGAGGGAVKLSKGADGTFKADEVYFSTQMQNHHGGMVVIDGCLYGANGGNSGGSLTCLDFKTGKMLWRDRAAPKGSVAFADGRIYYRTEDGTLLLIEPNPEKYVERGRFDQPDRTKSPAWSHPVIANGKLYIRDQDVLYCYDVKAK
ncbi:MAG: PQQ-binding-like beta-propeller repeat protein [Phycisphaerales bacterium]|nr:PQQ-binding-like beta-propeller repeat protein [Phycisphaerales bacterium]